MFWGFPGSSDSKASACSVGDLGSIPGLGRSPGEGNGNSLQYSCLENSMDWGAWYATVLEVAKSRTWVSDFTFTSLYNVIFFWDTSKSGKEVQCASLLFMWDMVNGTGKSWPRDFEVAERWNLCSISSYISR